MPRQALRIWIYLLTFSFGTGAVIWFSGQVNPNEAAHWEFGVLYALAFLVIFSLATIAGYVLRALFWDKKARYDFLRSAERQGALLGFFGVICLLLSAAGLLHVWSAASLLGIFILIELYAGQ